MSYFDAVYMDHELSPRAKMVCMYLRDRANREGESWYAIGTIASDLGLSRSTVSALLAILSVRGASRSSRGTEKTVDVPPTFIGCCEKRAQSPPRGDCARLLDWGPGH